MYAIKNNGRYVANPGLASSFTHKIDRARKFATREEAEANACGNESVIELRMTWGE